LADRSSAKRVYKIRGDFGQRQENKSTRRKARMRYRKTWIADDAITVKDDIDIDCARALSGIARAIVLFFDLKADTK
jgi:hypothetical protein